MKYKIVSDSASNIHTIENVSFTYAPLHIIVGEKDFADDDSLDLEEMEQALSTGQKSGTACPGIGDWLEAFGDVEVVFCVTITSALSGSCSAARAAKDEYEEQFPARRVHVIDSLSAGPEMALIIEKLRELICSNMGEEDILHQIKNYTRRSHLLFCLKSLRNLASNGRVNPSSPNSARSLASESWVKPAPRAHWKSCISVAARPAPSPAWSRIWRRRAIAAAAYPSCTPAMKRLPGNWPH